MRFLFASDSFKGTISSTRISELLTQAAHEVLPEAETVGLSVADGGEGTVDAVLAVTKGQRRTVTVHDPLGREVEASYGLFPISNGESRTLCAIIEMSAASGLPLVAEEDRNPLKTTTYGTGELLRDAIEQGCRRVLLAIGGSATNDGGMGAMRALGVRFLDFDGEELTEGCGSELAHVGSIDTRNLMPELFETDITVLCDVDNHLTGPDGATFTFGRQKCSEHMEDDETNEILLELESGMQHYAEILKLTFGLNPDEIPGTGSAGGLGAALCIILGAGMNSGIEAILDIISFDSYLDGVTHCITGEGRIDWQSTHDKTLSGIVSHCKKRGIPVSAIVGYTGEGFEDAYEMGLEKILRTMDEASSFEDSIEHAEEYYLRTAKRFFELFK